MILGYFDVYAPFLAPFIHHQRVSQRTLFYTCLTSETFCFSRWNKMFL